MEFYADMKNKSLIINSTIKYKISCDVRTLQDGTRLSYEVVETTPGGRPYMPAPFPAGKWLIVGTSWQKDAQGKSLFSESTYGPVKILTNAFQWVHVWRLDDEGDYLHESSEVAKDSCYWFHYSTSSTTLGCIRLYSPEDAIAIGRMVDEALLRNEPCPLEVVY